MHRRPKKPRWRWVFLSEWRLLVLLCLSRFLHRHKGDMCGMQLRWVYFRRGDGVVAVLAFFRPRLPSRAQRLLPLLEIMAHGLGALEDNANAA